MSEVSKNYREMRGAWCSFTGGLVSTLFALVALVLGPSFFTSYPATNPLTAFLDYVNDLTAYFNANATVPSPGMNILFGYFMIVLILVGGLIAMVIGLIRKKVFGMSISGFMLLISIGIIYVGLTVFVSLLSSADVIIRQNVGVPEVYGFAVNMIPLILALVLNIISGIVIAVGSLQLFAARPIPVASYRRKRMQFLAKADNLERSGSPVKAIKFNPRRKGSKPAFRRGA